MADWRRNLLTICLSFTGDALKLIITRHAKSSWDDPLLDDHDRPHNERGRKAASRIGRWIADQGHVPAHVLCSTAERAKWTCARAIEEMTPRPVVNMESGLYHASPDRILRLIQGAPAGDLMVVGHNPGFAEFADMITAERPQHVKFRQYPTAATLVVETDIEDWAQLSFGSGKLVDFVVPRDLDPTCRRGNKRKGPAQWRGLSCFGRAA